LDDLIRVTPQLVIPLNEIELRFSRSAGPGGQKVNKTSTRVELLYDVAHSAALSDAQRELLLVRLHQYLDGEGVLHLTSSTTASQWRNRLDVLERLRLLLAQALQVPKRRIATRPTRASIERRLARKRQHGELKRQRQEPSDW